jgi:hypothetical protein
VNPSAESDLRATAIDEGTSLAVASYAFRQAAGIGTFLLDDLRVGTRFSDVIGFQLQIRRGPAWVEVTWPLAAETEGYHLQGSLSGRATDWQTLNETPERNEDRFLARVPLSQVRYFFRLAK